MFSTPFAIISYFLIWFVPDISKGQVMWYLVFYCAFQTLVTVSQALLTPGGCQSLPAPCWAAQRGRNPPCPCPLGCHLLPEPVLLVPLQCFHVPYSALTMFISREQSERDSATAYRKNSSFPVPPSLSSLFPLYSFSFLPFPFPFTPLGFGGSCSTAWLAHFSLGRTPAGNALLWTRAVLIPAGLSLQV